MNKEENDKWIADLLRKIEEEKAQSGQSEGFVKKLGFTVYPNLEEAFEAQRKKREARKKRIEARKRAKRYSSGS